MTTISGIIGSALLQSPTVPSLSSAQRTALDDILKKYTPDNFSKKDFLNLEADLKKTGISATPAVIQAIESKGFNIEQYANVTDPQGDSDAFGPAVTLDLSSPGKAVIDSNAGNAAPASAKTSAPVVASVSYDSVSEAVTKAKREVSPQIGVGGADEVVDAQGDINYSKLHQLLDLQAAKRA